MLSGSPPYAEVDRGVGLNYDAFYRLMRKDNKRFWEIPCNTSMKDANPIQ